MTYGLDTWYIVLAINTIRNNIFWIYSDEYGYDVGLRLTSEYEYARI